MLMFPRHWIKWTFKKTETKTDVVLELHESHVKLLLATAEELKLYKDTVSCERLREQLSKLPAKADNVLELLEETEEEILMDKLEADIIKEWITMTTLKWKVNN